MSTMRSHASMTRSGKKLASPPPTIRGRKRATSAVDHTANQSKKKKKAVESNVEENEEEDEVEDKGEKGKKGKR